MAEQKKSGRVKRSRLGRGLSALVEVAVEPVVVEANDDHEVATPPVSKSDNSHNKERATPAQEANIRSGGAGVKVGARGVGSSGSSGGAGGAGEVKSGGGGGGRGRGGGSEGGGDDGGGTMVESSEVVAGTDVREDVEAQIGEGVGEVVGEGAGGTGGARGVRGVEIGVGLIEANRDQPRRVFDEESLRALADSILEHGLIQPIVVRRIEGGGGAGGDSKEGRYELIAGERRWRASKMAGLAAVAAIVRDVDDATSAQLALIENIQREDLNAIELAEGYRSLSERHGMTQERIAKTVGASRSSIANTVRLLDLPGEVQSLIAKGSLSPAHGKALLSLGSPDKQRKFAARCLREGWNVRELDGACRDAVGIESGESAEAMGGIGAGKIGETEDRTLSVLRDLERRMGEELGTRVRIRTDKSRTRGRVVIEFYDLDQFDGLLGRFGIQAEG